MTSLSITADTRKAERQLRRLGRDLNPRAMLKVIGFRLVREIDKGFRSEKQPGGKRWKPLAPSTLARRRGTSAKILQDTGRLKRSFQQGQPIRLSTREVLIGSNVDYADIHQEGQDHIPARPMLPTERHAEQVVQQEADAFVNKAVRKANG